MPCVHDWSSKVVMSAQVAHIELWQLWIFIVKIWQTAAPPVLEASSAELLLIAAVLCAGGPQQASAA